MRVLMLALLFVAASVNAEEKRQPPKVWGTSVDFHNGNLGRVFKKGCIVLVAGDDGNEYALIITDTKQCDRLIEDDAIQGIRIEMASKSLEFVRGRSVRRELEEITYMDDVFWLKVKDKLKFSSKVSSCEDVKSFKDAQACFRGYVNYNYPEWEERNALGLSGYKKAKEGVKRIGGSELSKEGEQKVRRIVNQTDYVGVLMQIDSEPYVTFFAMNKGKDVKPIKLMRFNTADILAFEEGVEAEDFSLHLKIKNWDYQYFKDLQRWSREAQE